MGVGGREGALVCKSRDCSPEVVGQQGGRRLGQVVVRWDRGWVVVRRPRSVDTRSGADRSNPTIEAMQISGRFLFINIFE